MFISKFEKEEMRVSIRTLQQEIKTLKTMLFELAEKVNAPSRRRVTIKTEEAPWGYKKDGTPRKRTGRPRQLMKVGQP